MFGQNRLSRRELLWQSGIGFGGLALRGLLADEERAAAKNPTAVRVPHFEPRAKRVIFLFMHGGPSQVDTFDYKPLLANDDGKPLPFDKPRVVSAQTGNLLRSPWKFQQHGQCGMPVSELFPHVAGCVDDLCFINSMWCTNSRHGGAAWSCTPAATRSSGPAWGRGSPMAWGPRTRTCPASSPSARR